MIDKLGNTVHKLVNIPIVAFMIGYILGALMGTA